ncbi:OFA family MFS transporter [Nesterenkonia cremea]|uniref:MFS transporter n=1 Tax=Nesterenkonia cremea TaxID=1882340 RepID=A0A917ATS2_9MICC|nr:OFA family MFS transporter [Nesterenkonia cremea]GGE73966.1 MFS transporter [Nesterenkonia cremea]
MSAAAPPRSAPMQKITAGPDFNRWLIPPAALGIHMCIGQVYGTSVYRDAIQVHFDASHTAIGIIFSLAIVMLGLSAALFGSWVDRNGPRRAILASTVCWVSGFVIGSVGIFAEQLWLLYLGYGVIGGIGLGIGYIAPVSTLMKWFPDRPGMGTGMAIMGFGVGAMIATPLSNFFMNIYNGGAPGDGEVHSGSSVGMLFLTLAALYLCMMLFSALIVRVPAPDWKPAGFEPAAQKKNVSQNNVRVNTAMKTPQFWLLWTVLFVNITAGIGILEQANAFVRDFFRDGDGNTAVALAAAGGFVAFLSLTNTLGRFIWASTSDRIGRKPIYMIYLGLGALLYFSLATWGNTSMALFIVLAGIILSFYGGGFATIPAYLRDLFGTFQVGAIHGRLLTAWACAGVAGPLIVNGFLDAAGGEPGTLTADAYRPALYTMVGLLVVGFIANLLVRPVSAEHHMENESRGADEHSADSGNAEEPVAEPTGKPIVPVPAAWLIVGIPILYGLTYTFINGVQLFLH